MDNVTPENIFSIWNNASPAFLRDDLLFQPTTVYRYTYDRPLTWCVREPEGPELYGCVSGRQATAASLLKATTDMARCMVWMRAFIVHSKAGHYRLRDLFEGMNELVRCIWGWCAENQMPSPYHHRHTEVLPEDALEPFASYPHDAHVALEDWTVFVTLCAERRALIIMKYFVDVPLTENQSLDDVRAWLGGASETEQKFEDTPGWIAFKRDMESIMERK